jgi:hypothetical protein
MSEQPRISVADIKTGDHFVNPDGRLGWEAIEDAETFANGEVSVRVQHKDGGISDRIWSSHEITIPVLRP